jgi:hypothetical protein
MTTFLAEYVDGGPGCSRDDCRLTPDGPSSKTLGHYPPVWDKNGNNLNPDMNILTRPLRCLSCGKSWIEEWQNGIRIS